MAQTEITVQIFDDIKIVEQKLLDLGFIYTETFSGKDYYFSTCDKKQLKTLSYKNLLDSSIIVRDFSKLVAKTNQTLIVHKLKNIDDLGNVISEEKTSFDASSFNSAVKLFSNAGLFNWLKLKQKNSFYKKDEVTIIVGTVENLDGCFIEIEEYPSIKEKSESEKFEILKQFVINLGFSIGNDFSCKKAFMLFNQDKR